MKTTFLLTAMMFCAAAQAQTFTLRSGDLGGQASLKQANNGFGCNGSNLSPQLSWENPPTGTRSYAVTIFDEDAPTGSGWWYWIIFDIDSSVTGLKTGAGNLAEGVAPRSSIQSKTDFGTPGYGGPCPPPGSGFHRYIVTVYALKTVKLGLDAAASPAMAGFSLNAGALAKASLVFYYKQ